YHQYGRPHPAADHSLSHRVHERSTRMTQFLTWSLLLTFVLNTMLPPALVHALEASATKGTSAQAAAALARPGQSLTLLPDGRWLLVGGDGPNGPQARASLWDPHSE